MTIQNGVYVREFDWGNDRDADPPVPISADRFDAEFDGVAEAINGIIGGTIPIVGAMSGGAMIGTVLAAIRGGVTGDDGLRVDVDRSVVDVITLTISKVAATHARYWLWSASANTPTAAEFLAGVVSMVKGATLPIGGGHLWYADIFDNISDIHEVGNENWREFFNAPVAINIGGTGYFAYGLSFSLDQFSTTTDWEAS